MVDQLIRTLVDHPKRKLLVIILTLGTGVMFGLPGVEEYSAARSRVAVAREKLQEASGTAANIPQIQGLLDRKKREVGGLERKAFTDKDVEHLRDGDLLKLIRDAGCEMRQVYIDENPRKRSWKSNDSPLPVSSIREPGQDTPFELAEWTARLEIQGPMENIYKFLAQMGQMDRFMNMIRVDMERSRTNEKVTELKMEFTLFDLVRKKTVKNGA